MKILLRYNFLFSMLFSLTMLLSACGSQTTQDGGTVTIQSSPFSEIKTIAAKVKAYLEIGGKTCEFELDPNDTTLKDNQKCTDIPMGSHPYKIVYKFMDTGVILANTEGTVNLISGKDNEIFLAPPEKDIDDDGDGFKNFYEILKGTNPKDSGSKPIEDKTPPAVSSTGPANGALNVPVNTKITATFSEPIDTKTITNTTFTVSSGNTNIPGTFSFNDMTVTFTPTGSLSQNILYTVTITTGVKDLVGNAMVGNYSWSFTTSKTGTGTDTTAPTNTTGTDFINSGAASTNSTNIILILSATDDTGVTGYCAKESFVTPAANDTCWTSIPSTTAYSAGVTYTLSSGDGTKTVYVWFKDAAGNVSSATSDSITLASLPSAPTGVTATAGDSQVTITWNTVSGATSYNIYWSTTSGLTKSIGTKIYGITTTSYTHTSLTNGTTYYYIVTALNSYGEGIESQVLMAIPIANKLSIQILF